MTVRPLQSGDYPWLLALSAANEVETGHIDADWLDTHARAWLRATVIEGEAYLIVFGPEANYDSPNFLWFRERMSGFAYVDRVVVSAASRGKGLARQLYEELFAAARAQGAGAVVCEVNLDPPNPGSDAFHARLGFAEVGRATLANGKTVRYLKRDL